MSEALPFIFAITAIVIALFLRPIAYKLLLPYPLFLVIFGFVFSEIIVGLGFDTGIRHHHYGLINTNIFIPAIIFSVSYSIDPKYLRRNYLAILTLGFPILLLTLVITAVLLYYQFAHPIGFPWIAAFITAALLSATYARGILDLLRQLKMPERLTILIEGESLFSEILAIILFDLFISIATMSEQAHSAWYWIGEFLWHILGGILIGIVFGFLIFWTLKVTKDHVVKALMTMAFAYLTFLISQYLVHGSGVLSVFCVGQAVRLYCTNNKVPFIDELWNFNTILATAGIFLLLGVTITSSMFVQRWLAMIIGIIGVFIARNIGVYGGLSLLSLFKQHHHFTFAEQTIVSLSGGRGSIAIALAFMIPESLDYWWTIQSIAFGVVLFTLLVQAPIVSWLVTRKQWINKLRE